MQPDEDPRRARTEGLQNLFIRLLFCDETAARLRDDPNRLAAQYGLPVDALTDIPDPDGAQMRAERHGRKMGVLFEIRRNFPNAWPALESLDGFEPGAFFSSDFFYDPDRALPHPFGVGPGYENASKFFFWARPALGLDRPGADPRLRLALSGDMASYLIGQYRQGGHDYFDRFAAGVFWCESPGADLPVMYMTPENQLFRYTDPAQRAELVRRNAADLDALTPEPPQRAENIR